MFEWEVLIIIGVALILCVMRAVRNNSEDTGPSSLYGSLILLAALVVCLVIAYVIDRYT
jgi:hypothetical protein